MEKSKKTQHLHTMKHTHIQNFRVISFHMNHSKFSLPQSQKNSWSYWIKCMFVFQHIPNNNQSISHQKQNPFFFSSIILIFGSKITESKWITTKKTRKRMPLQRDRRIIHRIERRIENLPVEHGRQGEIWGIVKNNEERRRVEGSKPKRGAFETGYEVSLAVGKIHWFRSLSFFHIYIYEKNKM